MPWFMQNFEKKIQGLQEPKLVKPASKMRNPYTHTHCILTAIFPGEPG